jgi:hypothetical protein
VAKPELVRTAAFFVARNGTCSERRKRLKLAIPEPFSLFRFFWASKRTDPPFSGELGEAK